MNSQNKHDKKFPKGHFVGIWMGIGLAMFAGLGVPLSVATGNTGLIGLGPAMGLVFGTIIGQIVEKNKDSQGLIRELTPAERRSRSYAILAGLVILVAGMVIFIALLQ
jgi:hypothetical protein